MRRLFPLFFILMTLLAITACDNDDDDDDNDDVADDDADDDDDDTAPPPSDPWNESFPRPTVTIVSPTPGEFVEGDSVAVQGTVTGPSVDHVTINDVEMPVVGGAFGADVALDDADVSKTIYVTAFADDGSFGAARVAIVHGAMAPAEEIVPDALEVALGNQALATIGALLGQAIQDVDLMPILEPLNPIIDTMGITVSITDASIGGADLIARFLSGGLGMRGALTDVVFGAELTLFGGDPTAFTVSVGSFGLEGLFDITVADGAAAVSISNLDVSHEDAEFTGAVPDFVGELILGALEGAIEWMATSVLPPALEGLLADLSIETTLIGLDLELGLTTIDVDAGGMVAGFDLNATVADADTVWPRGSLTTPGAAPDLLDAPAAFGFAGALGDDVLNRLLLALADSGLLTLSIGAGEATLPLELNAGTISFLFETLANVDPDTPVTLALSAAVPPVAYADADGALWLRVPDWRLEIYLDPADHEPWRAMELSLDITFAIDADAADGALRVSLPALAVEMRFIDNPLGDTGSLATFLVEWLPDLLGAIVDVVLQGLPIELPPILGVQIAPLWWGTTGENLDYWTTYFGMSYAPPEEFALYARY